MSDHFQYKDIARRLGVDDSTVRRLVTKHGPALGITVQKGRSSTSNSKWTHFLSREDADRLMAHYESQMGAVSEDGDVVDDEFQVFGFFYVIQLIPEAIPNRIKIGYTDNLEQRLRDHQSSAPTARVLARWPCKRSWDYAAMDCITRDGCKWVLNEVWEGDPEGFIARGNAFFSNMPAEDTKRELSEHSPLMDKGSEQDAPPNAGGADAPPA